MASYTIPASRIVRRTALDPTVWGREIFETSVSPKLDRADEHLRTLSTEMRDVLTSEDKSGLGRRVSDDGTVLSWYFGFRDASPISRWGTIIGDVVHNLRSGLDSAVFALAVHHHLSPRPPNERNLAFPIADSIEAWRKVRDRIKGIGEDAASAIRRNQPFETGDPTLAILNRLSNLDKHTAIHLAHAAVLRAKVPLLAAKGKLLHTAVPEGPILSASTPAIELTFSEPNPEFAPRFPVTIRMLISHGAGWVDPEDYLTAAATEVRRIADHLKTFVLPN